MRKRYGIIFAVIGYIVFFFCIEGWGADWKLIGRDVEGTVFEIDMASISLQPNYIVRALLKKTHSKESINDFVKEWGGQYKDLSYSQILYEFHCTEKKSRILSGISYSLGGGELLSDNSPRKWEFVIPDSVGEIMFEEVAK